MVWNGTWADTYSIFRICEQNLIWSLPWAVWQRKTLFGDLHTSVKQFNNVCEILIRNWVCVGTTAQNLTLWEETELAVGSIQARWYVLVVSYCYYLFSTWGRWRREFQCSIISICEFSFVDSIYFIYLKLMNECKNNRKWIDIYIDIRTHGHILIGYFNNNKFCLTATIRSIPKITFIIIIT